jgi:hypothetical protein
MKLGLSLSLVLLSILSGCSSSSNNDAASTPVIDSLDVPQQTSVMTVQGQSGPGVIMTLSAHDDSAGINALHIVFPELGTDHVLDIPNAPTSIVGQKIEFLVVNAPQGDHAVQFHITDAKGHQSASIDKTITVP